MGGDKSAAQESTPESGLPYEQMWRRLRESLENIDDVLKEFVAKDLKSPDKIAAQVHGAEHFSVKGILGYMDFIEAQSASGARAPGPGLI